MSSAIMSQPAAKRSARMLSAKAGIAGVGGGEAELGAWRDVVDDLEHRRALVALALLAGSTSTSAGSSPEACEALSESTPSESTQTFTPVPVTLSRSKTVFTPCAATPSETTAAAARRHASALAPRCSLVRGVPPMRIVLASAAGSTRSTSPQPAIVRMAEDGTAARTAPLRGET